MNYTYHTAKNEHGVECMVVLLESGRNATVCPPPPEAMQPDWARGLAVEMAATEWMRRYADFLVKHAELSREVAEDMADTAYKQELESCDGCMEHPEDAAETEMSYWADN